MKKLLLIAFLFPLALSAQTYTRAAGTYVGNQVIISIPVSATGGLNKQALVYLPDDYGKTKKNYPLCVWLHGAGESNSPDIAQVNNTGLPQFLANGLKPYSIDPVTGDTVKWIVISPHCTDGPNCSYSYPQLQYTIPYLMANYRVDPTCVWVAGLSAGGSGAWSCAMGQNPGDTALAKKLAGVMPISNGGYDTYITTAGGNLDSMLKRGLSVLTTLGSQDQGYNPTSFGVYWNHVVKNGVPGHYYDTIIAGGIHNAAVWNLPFPLTARLWSKTMNSWTQMWSLRKNAASIKPAPSVPHAVIAVDSSIINYPNSVVHLNGNQSYASNGKISSYDYFLDMGDSRVIMSGSDSGGVCISGLRPGNYRFKLVVTDSLGNKDSAYATAVVNPVVIPACPVCQQPVVCPTRRKAIGFTIDAVTGKFLFTYDDGNP